MDADAVSWRVSRPSFSSAYAAGKLAELYALAPGDTSGALGQPRNADRAALSRALRRYARTLGAPAAVERQLELLEHPDSRAVVTGQQAGLLLGPSYTLSKAVSAIGLAQELSTPEQPVTAIFWVASQDHDTAEIDHTYLLDNEENLRRLSVDLPPERPAGRIDLQRAWLEALLADLGEGAHKTAYLPEVETLLRETFETADTFADWFAALLYRLLGAHGLVVLNPLEPDIAPLFGPVLRAELVNPEASVQAIGAAGERVRELGYEPQLGRGEDATNLFTEVNGKRTLLRFDGETFYTGEGETHKREALLERLSGDPSSVTPAAGLRPITQDAALPTAATVVGPGELRYFAQLRPVYEHHGVAMPLLWPRTSVSVLEPPVQRIMNKFDLSLAELETAFGAAREAKLLELSGHAESFAATLKTLEASFEALRRDIRAIDPTLEGTLSRGEGYLRTTLDIFKTKSARAVAERDKTYARQFERLRAQLLPLDTPQERLISPFSFFLKFGVDAVIGALLELPSSGHHAVRF